MACQREWVVSIDEKVKREIKFTNNNTITTKGEGKVLIQIRDVFDGTFQETSLGGNNYFVSFIDEFTSKM